MTPPPRIARTSTSATRRSPIASETTPKRKHPITFTANVAHGKAGGTHGPTARATLNRNAVPTAPPSETRSKALIDGHAIRGRVHSPLFGDRSARYVAAHVSSRGLVVGDLRGVRHGACVRGRTG